MIGQLGVRRSIKKLVDRTKFPQFLIVCGIRGSGKSLIIDNICNNILHCTCEKIDTIDDIRKVCVDAVNYTDNHAIVLSNFESLNFRTKESILKLCEDTPPNLYIFIETNDIASVKTTLINRAFVIMLEPYTDSELLEYCNTNYSSDSYDFNSIIKIFRTPGDIKRVMAYDVSEFINFCEKVLNFIYISPISNVMKISNSLKLKSDGSGYDLDLFLSTIRYLAFLNQNTLSTENKYRLIDATTNAIFRLNSNKSLNKLMIFDNWILSIRKCDYNA